MNFIYLNNKAIYVFSLFLSIILYACSSPISQQEKLRQKFEARFDHTKGTFALAFVNLSDTSQSLMINEKEMFHAASTMKTPVMIEVFKQAEAGTFDLADSIEVKNNFRSIVDGSFYKMDIGEDSDEKLYSRIGKKMTVDSLVYYMITTSSNLATNILVGKVGAKNITQTMRELGADSIRVLRGVEDIKAFKKGMNNETNARDLMFIFQKLGQGNVVSTEASRAMVNILKQQHFNDMIPARLPDSVEVAHKTGWITGVHHDSGLIMLPDGRKYVLVLLSKKAPQRDKVINMFAGISRDIYDYVVSNKK